MRYLIPAFAALMLAVTPIAGHAQTAPMAPSTAQTGLPDTAAPAPKVKMSKLTKRFNAANTTHDGHLTLEQAKAAKWTQVVSHFATIDADKKGYVTEPEIKSAAVTAKAAKAKPAATKS